MKILQLTLKKQWFDMISDRIKKEEYREIKDYWKKRFNKAYTHVLFRNGYSSNSLSTLVELKRIDQGLGIIEWGAPEMKQVYILQLGDVILSRQKYEFVKKVVDV